MLIAEHTLSERQKDIMLNGGIINWVKVAKEGYDERRNMSSM